MGSINNIVTKEFGNLNAGFIITDVLLEDSDTIGNILQVNYTPWHTPDHISLYGKDRRILIDGDTLFNFILDIYGLFGPPFTLTDDWNTSIVSARSLLSLKIESLLIAHQSNPILENASRMIENTLSFAIIPDEIVPKEKKTDANENIPIRNKMIFRIRYFASNY